VIGVTSVVIVGANRDAADGLAIEARDEREGNSNLAASTCEALPPHRLVRARVAHTPLEPVPTKDLVECCGRGTKPLDVNHVSIFAAMNAIAERIASDQRPALSGLGSGADARVPWTDGSGASNLCAMRQALTARVSVLFIAATLLAACGSAANVTGPAGASKPSVSTTTAASAQRLPPRVLLWLRNYNAYVAPGRATSASWVLTTHDKSGPFVGGAIFPDRAPVYLFDLEGHFAWDHSCPPSSPPSACRSVGRHAVFTLDARLLQIKDFGVANAPAHLATLGIVGHVAL
jgi:hypothetical protein